MQFSTLNENSLHKSLKNYYSIQTNGKTEVENSGFVYDIITEKDEIIEIQTGNVSKLYKKIEFTLKQNRKITLVHPVSVKTKIKTIDINNKEISQKYSPKHQTVYSALEQLTKIYPFLLKPNFTLEIPEITATETRKITDEPVQSKNKQRRFKKNWNKENKELNEIIKIWKFKTKEDYLKLLPENLPEIFCAKQIEQELKKIKYISNKASKISHLILWLYVRMNLIKLSEKKGNTKYYKLA